MATPELPPDLADLACARLLEVAGDQQEAVLADLCRAHPEYDAALRQLHADLTATDRLLEGTFCPVAEPEPGTIGPFRVVRRLGAGAFGVVYLCTQSEPIAREVAVKVLRPGAGSRETLARFWAERQLLAAMNHPAIAHVFDAGALADGRPYFVLEHVAGAPITTYCEQRDLPLAERLVLFLALCEGVQHAHQKGVIHRDLKPSNVLVRDLHGAPQPKIIDFGLAKVLGDGPRGSGQLTEGGRVLGTPGFMSPEQGAGRHGDVDTRTDVFALGVILYVLLAGALPWARDDLAKDRPPLRPSARVGPGSDGGSGARRRSSLLRGDLDWITLRALEHDREQRYQSVQELAADLRRHLRHEPVLAGPPSTAYRLRKLARRYRVQVIAGAAVLAALLLGLFGTLVYAARAHDNLQRFEMLALSSRLAVARATARALGPPWPEQLAAYDRWLEEQGTPLAAELPRLRAALAELRARALPYGDGDRADDRRRHPVAAEVDKKQATIAYAEALLAHPGLQGADDAPVRQILTAERDRLRAALPALLQQQGERRTWRFPGPGQQFLHDTLMRLWDELALFCTGDGYELPVVQTHRQQIADGMADLAQRAARWQQAAAEVAADPRYGGLQLAPQFGLVPLGRDPVSGLQEFYHPRSGPVGGAIPERDAGGRLRLDEKAGIVFVLLPGGRTMIGAQRDDPDAPCYDAQARRAQSPVHEVTLAPFLLGKHEVTQGQWWYLTGTLPSHIHKKTVVRAGPVVTDRHPVESVSWDEAQRGLQSQGLALPTEAQWEYACRAGTTTVWPTGNDLASLAGFAHTAPGADGDNGEAEEFAPGIHAPVGHHAANAFGLHDMVGNVAEWCRDYFSSHAYLLPAAADDGLRPVPEVQVRPVRGGSFEMAATEGSAAARHPVPHNTRARSLGMRAARRLQVAVPAPK